MHTPTRGLRSQRSIRIRFLPLHAIVLSWPYGSYCMRTCVYMSYCVQKGSFVRSDTWPPAKSRPDWPLHDSIRPRNRLLMEIVALPKSFRSCRFIDILSLLYSAIRKRGRTDMDLEIDSALNGGTKQKYTFNQLSLEEQYDYHH